MTTTNVPAALDRRTARPGRLVSLRGLAWAGLGVAVVATGALAVQVLDDDPTAVVPAPPAVGSTYSAETGSIAAIDHAATAATPGAAATAADRGSITALDHAATAGSGTSPSAADPVWFSAEHGSIAAIDHAAEAG